LHARTLSPSQLDWLGMHSVQAHRSGAQIFPAAVQSDFVTHAGAFPSHVWSWPTAHRCEPATHAGPAWGLVGIGCHRSPESKQLGATSPAALASSNQAIREGEVRRLITGAR
jgi:hypothetical protein